MSYGVVYKITNKQTGQMYIGGTTNYKVRCNGHKKRFNPESHNYEIIDDCTSKTELQEKELYWVNYYDAINKGYNRNDKIYARTLKRLPINHFIDDIKTNTNVYYITIPVGIIRGLNLKKNDFVDISIKKIKYEEVEVEA